jgi:4,4'-diaponeurosporenoate glycosyltransferase
MEPLSLLFIATCWLLGFLVLFRIPTCSRNGRGPSRAGSVSIIIPARNEAENLPRLLNSLRAQTTPPDEVIVVDDSSEDATAAVARQGGASVVTGKPIPPGWIGKTWACHQGAQAATGTILFFLDADTYFEPDGLARVLDTHHRHGGVLSIQPYHTMETLAEELSAFFNIIQMGATTAFTVLGNRVTKRGLFGPSLILERELYVRVGGHESVKDKILEDYYLAQNFNREGIPIHCYGGRGAVSFRMYPHGLPDIVLGWSKAFAAGARRTFLITLLVIVAWVTGSADTTRNLLEAAWAGSTPAVSWCLVIYLCYAAQIFWFLRRIGTFGFYTALLFPLPLLFLSVVFSYSLFLLLARRPVRWKNRSITTAGPTSP